MIHRVITGIVGQMEKEHLIMPQEKDDYIYAYEVICEKVISLGTIVILGMLLDNLVNTVLYILFFLTLRKRTGGFHMPTFFKCYIGSVILYLITVSVYSNCKKCDFRFICGGGCLVHIKNSNTYKNYGCFLYKNQLFMDNIDKFISLDSS